MNSNESLRIPRIISEIHKHLVSVRGVHHIVLGILQDVHRVFIGEHNKLLGFVVVLDI